MFKILPKRKANISEDITSIVPISESSDPLIKEKKKRRNKKIIRLIIVLSMFIGLLFLLITNQDNINGEDLASIFNYEREAPSYENDVIEVKEEIVTITSEETSSESSQGIQPIYEDYNDSNELNEYEGFGEVVLVSNLELNEDNKLESKVLGEEDVVEPIVTNNNPDIDIDGPDVEEKTNFTTYTYKINLTELGVEKYGEGFMYYIEPVDCKYDDFIVGNDTFQGEFVDVEDQTIEVEIFVSNTILDPELGNTKSRYELVDLDGELITKGAIDVPTCKRPNEENRFGEFSVDDPILDLTVLQGVHNFTYYFSFDEIAKDLLEEGFSYEFEASDCLGAGLNSEDYYFEGEIPPGEINNIGFSVNIKSSSLYDTEDGLYKTSIYKILSEDDIELFSGYVDVPNCVN